MNKDSLLLFFLLGIITFVLILFFSLIYDNENSIFCAEVVEVYPGSALVIPDKVGYEKLLVNIVGFKIGDRVKIYAKKEIKETYPPIAEVIKYEVCSE